MPIVTETFSANAKLDIGEDGNDDQASVDISLKKPLGGVSSGHARASITFPAGTIQADAGAAQKEAYGQLVQLLRKLASDLQKKIR